MNVLKSTLLLWFFVGVSYVATAQEITQVLRGRVLDVVSGAKVAEASILINELQLATTADTNGIFKIEKVPVGRYHVTVSSVGFQPIILSEVLVESGKEAVLNIYLKQSQTELDTLTCVALSSDWGKTNYPSVNVVEKLRFQYPATYADPARYASYAAGVTTDNDQANNLSIRGTSPNALQWYLEGAEIVNPNHLSNAGTLTDRASANGGGVMILSTQLLQNTTLYQGAMPPQYANALSGALDMQLRKGNDSRRQNTIQLSLIGLDATTEGNFSKDSKASYLVNYRYATVGLLSKLGVPLGDEAINYQDASFHFNLPTKKAGEFSIFGVGGKSENIFKAKMPNEWTADKDSQDITYTGKMGALGMKHFISLGQKMKWQSVFVASSLENQRMAVGYNRLMQPTVIETVNNTQSKYFFRTEIDRKMGSRTEGVLGVVVKNEFINNENIVKKTGVNTNVGGSGSGTWVIPYADISGKMTNRLSYKIGVRGTYFSFNEKLSIEPSAILNYKLAKNTYLQANYSRQSQLVQPQFYFQKSEKGVYLNRDLDFVKSDNVSLNFTKTFNKELKLSLEGFYQAYSNVYFQYVNAPQLIAISILDDLNSLNGISSEKGTATSTGATLSVSQNLKNGLFWQANVAVFDARFKNDAGVNRSLSYNSRYTTNVLLGKEWTKGSMHNKFFGVSGRAVLRGGFWTLSSNNKWTQVSDYFRTDLNIYYKKNHKKWLSTIQLDIQNLTNRENEWALVYDNFQKRYIAKKQLGMIPNLAYKIEF